MKAGVVARLRSRGAEPVLVGLRSVLIRLRIKSRDISERRSDAVAKAAGPTVQERREELIEFYEKYELFVETLCDAAQYGPSVALEASHARLRGWIHERYPSIRPFVSAYMPPNDAISFRLEKGRAPDCMEELISSNTLEEFLRDDDGGMIQRITFTREALNLYGQHLRQLAARTA